MNTTDILLIPLPALPPAQVSDKRTLVRINETGGFETEEVTIEEFREWFDNPPQKELLYEVLTKDDTGKERITYRIDTIGFAMALYLRFLPLQYAKRVYIYSSDDLLYSEDSGEMTVWVRRQLEDLVLKEFLPKSLKPDAIVREIVHQASEKEVIGISGPYPFNNYDGFPANNCVIRFNPDGTVATEKFSRKMRFTRKSPVSYNPHASTEKAERILKEWLDGTDEKGRPLWEYLVQIPAQAVYQSLAGNTPYKQAYMLVGESDSGRSTYNEVLKDLFGENNVSTLELQAFSERFSSGALVDKFVNFGDDLPSLCIGEGNRFKKLVGLEKMSVEKKFQNIYMARITAVHVYSANDLPHLDENLYTDQAWWSRWALLKWIRKFARDPVWKKENIDTEFYEGYLLLIIGEVCKIIRNHQLTLTQDPDYVKTEWLGSETKLHEFVMLSLEQKAGSCIDSDCMLESLQLWAEKYMPTPPSLYNDTLARERWRDRQRQLLPTTKGALTQALKKEGIWLKQIKVRRETDSPDAHPRSKYIYENIRFRDYIAWAKFPDYRFPGVR